MTSEKCIQIFQQCIADYHITDDVNAVMVLPYQSGSVEALLYNKCRTDTVQWHLEDMIRNPVISPEEALQIKRKIDVLNQQRTNLVEQTDDWFLQKFNDIATQPNAAINTETPAWAIDRLSILELKIYHMDIETQRPEASVEHRQRCYDKLMILREQRDDLSLSVNQLLDDLSAGMKKMKVYRQMKMYNDNSLNPVLYNQKNNPD